MKKIISTLGILAIILLAGCSSDSFGEFKPQEDPAKGVTVAGLDKKDKNDEKDKMTLHVEATHKLVAQCIPAYATDKDNFIYEYKSSKLDVATIDAKGVIKTGDAPGETEITVIPTNNLSMTYTFTVKVIKNEIKSFTTIKEYSKGIIIPATKELEIGGVIFTPADASLQKVKYEIPEADKAIAIVDSIKIADGVDKEQKPKFKNVLGIKTFKIGKTTLTITPLGDPAKAITIDVEVVETKEISKNGWIIDYLEYKEHIVDETGKKDFLIDNDPATFMALGKPGKLGVPRDARPIFVIDRNNDEEFHAVQIIHSSEVISKRIETVSILGRDAAVDSWTAIEENIVIPDVDKEEVKSPVVKFASSTYRYVKVEIKKWNTQEGGEDMMEIAEFNLLGNKYE